MSHHLGDYKSFRSSSGHSGQRPTYTFLNFTSTGSLKRKITPKGLCSTQKQTCDSRILGVWEGVNALKKKKETPNTYAGCSGTCHPKRERPTGTAREEGPADH